MQTCRSSRFAQSVTVAIAAFMTFGASTALATAQRTFVASTGVDTNACSLTAPCRSFGAAILQTSAFGEVIVQDSAGYGPVTITKSVSITSPAGVYAGITVMTGDGIYINTSNLNVKLVGLSINGQSGTGSGIVFIDGGLLVVDRCTVRSMSQNGITITGNGTAATITDTRVEDNGDAGVRIADGARVTIERLTAVLQNSGSGAGVRAEENTGGVTTHVVVRDSHFAHNFIAIVARSNFNGGAVFLTATGNTIADGTAGIEVVCGPPCNSAGLVTVTATANTISSVGTGLGVYSVNAVLIATGNTVTNSTTGVNQNAGTLRTLQNNTIEGNYQDITGTLTPATVR